jgi:hypothetical protein
MADFLLAAPVNSDAQAPDQMAEHALERSGATPNALKRPGEDSKCMPRLAATHASDVVMPCLCAGDKVTHPQKSGDQKKMFCKRVAGPGEALVGKAKFHF